MSTAWQGAGRRIHMQEVGTRDGTTRCSAAPTCCRWGVMIEAACRGIDMPRQLSVVGFGDLPGSADLHPALTSVHINSSSIGRMAGQFIVDRAEGRAVDPRIVDIGFPIIERQSA